MGFRFGMRTGDGGGVVAVFFVVVFDKAEEFFRGLVGVSCGLFGFGGCGGGFGSGGGGRDGTIGGVVFVIGVAGTAAKVFGSAAHSRWRRRWWW